MNTIMLFRESWPIGFCIMSACLGGILGSFLGVVSERVPAMVMEKEGAGNLLFPASHCADCGHQLAWWENIPLLSWCCLRGRCRHCQSVIPLRLLLVESASALFFAATAAVLPSSVTLIALWVLWCGLLPLTMIDAKYMLLPDCLTQSLLWAGLLLHCVFHTMPLASALYGAVAGYLILWLVYWSFRLLTGREGLGQGDFKLLAALGAWCGWQALPLLILVAALSGIVLYGLFYSGVNKAGQIPFGPCLAFSGMVMFIFQTLQFTF
ncbi:TPA: prepilin peptidase [Citrobacter koseri]|nr:prepilin peptidase [Citrobacter koseri]